MAKKRSGPKIEQCLAGAGETHSLGPFELSSDVCFHFPMNEIDFRVEHEDIRDAHGFNSFLAVCIPQPSQ